MGRVLELVPAGSGSQRVTDPASAARTDHGRLLSQPRVRGWTPVEVRKWVPGSLPAGRLVTECPDSAQAAWA